MSYDPANSDPVFLSAQLGDFVVVEEQESLLSNESQRFSWIGRVLHIVMGARSTHQNSLFQLLDLESGSIRFVNADQVLHVFYSGDNHS